MILSLTPHFQGDENLPPRMGSGQEKAYARAMEKARAVVLPQSADYALHALCRRFTRNIFPDYSNRYGFEGKAGNFLLLEQSGLPHPETALYAHAGQWKSQHPGAAGLPFPFPFIMKTDAGGCGFGVHCIQSVEDIPPFLELAGNPEKNPSGKFVAQRFVEHGGRDLRVILAGGRMRTYWRIQDQPGEFRNNVGRGGAIDPDGNPDLTRAGRACAQALREKTGINLAAVDILFDIRDPKPLISEINFVFGRKGLGGTRVFRSLFREVVEEWIGGLAV